MTEEDLLNTLNDLSEDDFENFKWFLKKENMGDISPIQWAQLENAKRRDVVDLMGQKYEFAAAVKVMKSVLKKISRNDLVEELSNISSGAAVQSQEETKMTSHPDSEYLNSYTFLFFMLFVLVHSIKNKLIIIIMIIN